MLVLRQIHHIRFCRHFAFSSLRFSESGTSSTKSEDKSSGVVVTKSGVIACWHPAQKFPYEHTLPLPRDEQLMKEGDSALKLQLRLEDAHRHFPQGPSIVDMQNMFYTNKHIFYEKYNRARVLKNVPKKAVYRRGL